MGACLPRHQQPVFCFQGSTKLRGHLLIRFLSHYPQPAPRAHSVGLIWELQKDLFLSQWLKS